MINVVFTVKNRNTKKTFNDMENTLKFLNAKGYVYDEIDNYYWKTNSMFGWLMKAELEVIK